MYRTCIFCSADLGSNESIEHFPVGSALAFDAWKGRLWAVCPKCARWNLAPIEERWEATEAAEKGFVDARLRVQSENIGLARLPDGTKLIRVGEALPGELAAWRYGDQLMSRRWKHLPLNAGWIVLKTVIHLHAWPLSYLGIRALRIARGREVVHRVAADATAAGREIVVRRGHLSRSWLQPDQDGELGLYVPGVLPAEHEGKRWSAPSLLLRGESARRVVARAMVDVNAAGASRRRLDEALTLLAGAGSAEAYLNGTSGRIVSLDLPDLGFDPPGFREMVGRLRGEWREKPQRPPKLPPGESLALEMALHEAVERRALEGELAALEAVWREAEEIAAIADALPDELEP